MKKLLTVIVFIIMILLNNCTRSETKQIEKLCEEESRKSHPNKNKLEKYCIKTAEYYQKENSLSKFTFYYLLAGEYENNLNDIQMVVDSNTVYSNIAHSNILNGTMKEAKKYYTLFLKNTSISWVGSKVERDYKFLNKLYPEKKKNLQKGIQIWYEIYTPFGDLYTKYKKSLKSKQYKDSINYLSQLIDMQKSFQTKDNMSIFENEYELAKLYSLDQQYTKSLNFLLPLTSIYKEKYPIDYGPYLMWLGFNYEKLGNNEQAKKNYNESLLIQKNIFGEKDPRTAKAHRSLSRVLRLTGKVSQANTHILKANEIEKSWSKKTMDILDGTRKTAIFHYEIGDLTRAISTYEQALELIKNTVIYKPYREGVKTASFYYHLANLYLEIGDDSKAMNFIENSLKIRKKVFGDNHPKTAECYDTLGKIYQYKRNYPKAKEYYYKALKIREKNFGNHNVLTAQSYKSLATLYKDEKKYPNSLKYFQKALSIYKYEGYSNPLEYHQKVALSIEGIEKRNRNKIADTNIKLGSVYQLMKNYTSALKHYKNALFYLNRINTIDVEYRSEYPLIYNALASIFLATNKNKKAYTYSHKAFDIYQKNKDKIFTILSPKQKEKYLKLTDKYISVLMNTTHQYIQHLKNENNITKIQQVLQTGTNSWLNYKGSIFDSENAIDILYSTTKDKKLKAMIDELKSSKRHVAKLYQSLPKSQDRQQWSENITTLENKISKLSKTVSYETLNIKEEDDPMTSAFWDKQLKLSSEKLSKAREQSENLTKHDKLDTWFHNIMNKKDKTATLTNELASKASSFKEEQGLQSITFKDITAHLSEDELYIDYAKAGGYYYLFSLDKQENIEFIQIDKNSTKKIDSLIKTFREDVTAILNDTKITDDKLKALSISSKEKLSKLYELVINKPLSNTIKHKTSLIISPDGALRLLPFEALYNKEYGKYFIETKEIRYIPSGKEFVRLYRYSKDKVSKAKKSIVIFANPNFDTKIASVSKEEITITPNTNRSGIIKSLFMMRFSPLPGTQAEAKAIKATLNQKSILEYQTNKATESTLMKVKEPKILHIATHGFFINDNSIPNPMLKSGIALAGANTSAIKGKSDGIVTALKLSGLDLKGTDLVVLSACQTGVVDINSTDSVSGLSKAFIQAGAKDIVMSLWSVDDQATKELMTSFYQEMKENKNYANALKTAKLKMIEEGRHPFYWGAFVVSGL